MSQPRAQNHSEPEHGVNASRDDDVTPILPDEVMEDVEDTTEDMIEESIELSAEAADLVTQLQAERDEAVAARVRALADLANLEKRARREQTRSLQEGRIRVVQAILTALDNFDLALNQDPASMTAEQYVGGIRLVHEELFRALESHGLNRIVPREGDAFDPECHEAMFRKKVSGAETNAIVEVLQSGFALDETVLRPAKVAVAE